MNNKEYFVSTEKGFGKSTLSLTPDLENFISQLLTAMFESKTIFFTSKYIESVLNLFEDICVIKKEKGKGYKTEVLESKNALGDIEMKMRIEAFPNKVYGILYRLENFESGGLKFENEVSGKHIIFKMKGE